MKIKAITMLMVLAVLASGIAGCSQAKGDNMVQVMKIAPENALSITYFDLDAIKEDPDCEHRYDDMRGSIGSEMWRNIQISDISGYAIIGVERGTLFLQIGKYDIKDIRNNLKEQGYTEGEYRASEIWTSDIFGMAMAYTIIGNMVICGDKDTVEACLRVHKNDEPSMYDNKDVKSVLDKLPAGIFHIIIKTISERDSIYHGLRTGGFSISNLKTGDEVLDIKGWFKFESEADAEASLEDVKDIGEGFFFSADVDIDVQLKGQFIEITGEMDIEDF